MVGALVDVDFISLAGLLQRRLIGWDARIDALVEPAIVHHHGGVDLRHVLDLRLAAVIGHACIEVRLVDREVVHRAATPAEADGADLAVAVRASLQIGQRRLAIDDHVRLLQLADHLPALVLVGGRAAHGREIVETERDEALGRHAAGHVLDVRVETPVLMNDDHGRQLARGILRLHEIALEALRARNVHRFRRNPRIVLLDGLCLGIVVLQDRQQGCRGCRASGQSREFIEEVAAAHAAMGEVVIEVDDALIHGGLLVPGRKVAQPSGPTYRPRGLWKEVCPSQSCVPTSRLRHSA